MINLLKESFEVHDNLNPKIWTSNNTLIPEVRDHILSISKEFCSNIELPNVSIVDVHVLGSNASFNYNDNSDLDVHIVVNFEMMDSSKEVVQAMYNAEKNYFNDKYDITIHGIDVELYVEDIKSTTISNGIYSVFNNEWIKFPNKLTDIKEVDLEPELSRIEGLILSSLDGNSVYSIEEWINNLYNIRKNSLDTEGEYGRGNLIFKAVRNDGLLDKLKDKRIELKSKILSIESKVREHYSKGKSQIVNESFDPGYKVDILDTENKGTYIVNTELHYFPEPDKPVEIKSAYSIIDGSYIGDEDTAEMLVNKGITPMAINPDTCNVASIGFNQNEQKWYGWSHRAMYGFGIGDTVDSNDNLASAYLPVGFECEDLDDCMLCAISFAKSVD